MGSDGTFREVLWERNWALWRELVLFLSLLGYHEVKMPSLLRFLSQEAQVTKLLWTETSEFMSQIPILLKLILCLFSLGDMNKCNLPTIGHCQQTKETIQVQLGETMSLLELLTGAWVTLRQVCHQKILRAWTETHKSAVPRAPCTTCRRFLSTSN